MSKLIDRVASDYFMTYIGSVADAAIETEDFPDEERILETIEELAGHDTFTRIEDTVTSYGFKREEFGFINGFKYAFALAGKEQG